MTPFTVEFIRDYGRKSRLPEVITMKEGYMSLTVHEVAREAKIHTETVKRAERRGLPYRRHESGIPEWSDLDRERYHFRDTTSVTISDILLTPP